MGRKRGMQIVNLPMLGAWLCFHFSTSVHHLYAGLCLAGVAGGLLEAPVLTYVAEVTTPRVRGLLAASGSFFAILGVFLQFLMGTFLRWRIIALISLTVPIVSFSLLFVVPESPHWLIQKGRLTEAKASLAWLRGWVPVSSIEHEFQLIYNNVVRVSQTASTGRCASIKPYTKRQFLWPYMIITSCFFIGHFSGMTTLQTYAVQIFHTLKAPIDKYYATMLLGIAEMTGVLVCIILVHYTGKKPLVIISAIGCGVCFFGTATYAHYINLIPGKSINNIVASKSHIAAKPLWELVHINETISKHEDEISVMEMELMSALRNESEETNTDIPGWFPFLPYQDMALLDLENETELLMSGNDTEITEDEEGAVDKVPDNFIIPVVKEAENKYLWVPLTFLLGSAVLSHSGIRLIPWMLIGEIYPTEVRSGASGITGGTGYIFGFVSNKLFLKLISTLTLPGTFWMYSLVSLLGAGLLYFILPETEGRTLLEIEEHFTGGARLESKSNRKPIQSQETMDDGKFSSMATVVASPSPQLLNCVPQILVFDSNFQLQPTQTMHTLTPLAGHNGMTEAKESVGNDVVVVKPYQSLNGNKTGENGEEQHVTLGREKIIPPADDSRVQIDLSKSEKIFEKKLQERGGDEWLKKVKEIPKETQLAVALGMKRTRKPH